MPNGIGRATPAQRPRRRYFLIMIVLVLPAMMVSLSCRRNTATQAVNGTPTGGESMITAPIQIQSVDVLIAESNPPQVSIKVSGIIPDSCTKAREPQVTRAGSTFTISIIGEKPAGVACAQIVSPYQQTIPLGTLDPGSYTVVVNDIRKPFTVN